MELIDRKAFVAAALSENEETFVVHVAALLGSTEMTIPPAREAQIASLNVEEATIPSEYSDYANVFSNDSAAELPEHTGIDDHAIDPLDDKQPPYGLGPVELETLKTYTKPTWLAALSGLPSSPPALRYRLFKRVMEAFAFVLITEGSIT